MHSSSKRSCRIPTLVATLRLILLLDLVLGCIFVSLIAEGWETIEYFFLIPYGLSVLISAFDALTYLKRRSNATSHVDLEHGCKHGCGNASRWSFVANFAVPIVMITDILLVFAFGACLVVWRMQQEYTYQGPNYTIIETWASFPFLVSAVVHLILFLRASGCRLGRQRSSTEPCCHLHAHTHAQAQAQAQAHGPEAKFPFEAMPQVAGVVMTPPSITNSSVYRNFQPNRLSTHTAEIRSYRFDNDSYSYAETDAISTEAPLSDTIRSGVTTRCGTVRSGVAGTGFKAIEETLAPVSDERDVEAWAEHSASATEHTAPATGRPVPTTEHSAPATETS